MENLEDWRKAGKIAAEVREYGASLIKKNASYVEIIEKVEKKILELGAKPAFPPQMAMNEVAAHFTVGPNEDIKLTDQLVSLDVGVHVNGAIGDTAITVDLSGKYGKLIEASEKALENAIKVLQQGDLKLGNVGKAIQETITSYGYSPVKNLSGHGLDIFDIHTEPTVPNYDTGDSTEIEKDTIFAIEPFATNGVGLIQDSGNATIFQMIQKKPVRSQITREILKEIETYEGLPFATRDLVKKFPLFKVNFALRELRQVGALHEHSPLVEKNKGFVSQAEHTIYVDKKGTVEILTK